MRTKFATPTKRDLYFVRDSKFRSEDFAVEMKIANSMVDAIVIVGILIGILAALAFAS